MSRHIVNRLLIVVFLVIMCSMGFIYARQERSMKNLDDEYKELTNKSDQLEYVVNEYSILIDNVNTRNHIIRLAREKFGWVFDGEKIYKKDSEQKATPEINPDDETASKDVQQE